MVQQWFVVQQCPFSIIQEAVFISKEGEKKRERDDAEDLLDKKN